MSNTLAFVKRWRKAAGITLAAATFLTLLIGVMHMKFARRWLAQIGGCPVAGNASPERYETLRKDAAKTVLGTAMSPARPALGFALDKMTLKDAEAWAKSNDVSCDDDRKGTLFVCHDVPAAAVGEQGAPVAELALEFSLAGKLVNLTATRNGLTGDQAAAIFQDASKRLANDLGTPMTAKGEPTGSYLVGANFRTTLVHYAFRDYIADVSATNIDTHGVSLREHYLSARD